jgi:hypothetical protein
MRFMFWIFLAAVATVLFSFISDVALTHCASMPMSGMAGGGRNPAPGSRSQRAHHDGTHRHHENIEPGLRFGSLIHHAKTRIGASAS